MTAANATWDPFELAAEAAAEVNRWAGAPPHDVAIVLGSGWQGVADGLGTAEAERAASDFPGFPTPTVAGHHGELRSLTVGDHRVLLFVGRTHLYEGRSPAEVVHPVRTAVIANDRAELVERLREIAKGEEPYQPAVGHDDRGPVWIFSGQGSQWASAPTLLRRARRQTRRRCGRPRPRSACPSARPRMPT